MKTISSVKIIVFFVVFVSFVILIIFLAALYNSSVSSGTGYNNTCIGEACNNSCTGEGCAKKSTCIGEECHQTYGNIDLIYNSEICTENLLEDRLNPMSNPCTNFYSFACGKFPTASKPQMAKEVYLKTQEDILEVIEKLIPNRMPKAFVVTNKFLMSCKKDLFNEIYVNDFLKILLEIGGFPTLEGLSWNAENWSFMETTRKIRDYGLFVDSLFTISLGYNPEAPRNITYHIRDPKLTVTTDGGCFDTSICELIYVSEYISFATILGAETTIATKDGEELFNFENKLLNVISKKSQSSNFFSHKAQFRSIENLTSSWDFINWAEYFKILSRNKENTPMDFKVVVQNPEYLSSLKPIFQSVTKRVLANYMMWSVIYRISPGIQRHSMECFQFLQTTMSYALQALYARTHPFQSTQKSIITEIANGTKTELIKLFENSDWANDKMEEGTNMLEKLKQIQFKVGYPDQLLSDTFIDEYYESLKFDNNPFTNMINIHKFYSDKFHESCCKQQDDVFWDLSNDVYLPYMYYDNGHNTIYIHQGILQCPIFGVDLPMFVNYGRIGSLIGHEMVHALDSIGGNFDKEGKLYTYADQTYLKGFDGKAGCFNEQYDNFTGLDKEILKKNKLLSGEFKKLENVADSVGVFLAFRAYQQYKHLNNLSEPLTLGLKYSEEQLFFISFAQTHCADFHGNGEYFKTLLDGHALNPYRVEAPLQNLQDFSEAFGCENGNKTGQRKKCKIL